MRPISLLFLVASLGFAQDPASPETRDERVQVVLKNGHSLIGIAKAGLRTERLVRGNFKPGSEQNDRNSGIRVWYYQDLDGYIFLEHKALDHVDVLGTLTPEESRALSDAVVAAHGARVQSAASSRPSDKKAGGAASSESRPSADSERLTDAERALLQRFPPEKGWNPEKFGELQRRKIVLHVNPTTEEQSFIDDFPAFQGAWKKWLAVQPKPDDAPKTDEPAGKTDKKK